MYICRRLVPHSLFVEYIPSFDPVLIDTLVLKDGHFSPPERPGHGILFDKQELATVSNIVRSIYSLIYRTSEGECVHPEINLVIC